MASDWVADVAENVMGREWLAVEVRVRTSECGMWIDAFQGHLLGFSKRQAVDLMI